MPAAPKLPASIKVGHRDISIIGVDADELGNCYGDYTHSKGRIRLSDDLGHQHSAEILIHEILHSIWPSHPGAADAEEHLVTDLAPRLAQVRRDNPQLEAWLNWALK
jgi:hypothetical protein